MFNFSKNTLLPVQCRRRFVNKGTRFSSTHVLNLLVSAKLFSNFMAFYLSSNKINY